MADLASLGTRDSVQRRVTNNRAGVLPQRRDTDLAAVQVRADMRTAARGDGGASELRQTLNTFMQAGTNAYNAQTQANAETYQSEAAEGLTDAVAGDDADPAMARSVSYQQAFYRVRAESRFNAFSAATTQAVEQAVNDGADPAEVQQLLTTQVTAFREDVLDQLPPSAKIAAATRVAQMARDLDTTVSTLIRERTQEEFVATQDGNIATFLSAWVPASTSADDAPTAADASAPDPGDALDVAVTAERNPAPPFEEWIATYREAGFTPAEAKAKTVQAVMAVALDRDNPRPELLEQLLDSTQADGKTPTLNAAETTQVLDRITQARQLRDGVEREAREDRRDALVTAWYPRALAGEIVDDEINAAVATGDLTPQEGVQFLGMTEGLRDAAADGHVNDDFLLGIQERIARGRPPSVSQVSQWLAEGRLGTGRDARRAAITLISSASDASRAGRGSSSGGGGEAGGLTARSARSQNVTAARTYLMGLLDPGEGGDRFERSMRVRAGMEFNRRVVAGDDPMSAAEDLVTAFTARIAQGPRRRPAPPPLPTGTAAPPPGNYAWSP